jgi:hypothetical protein
MLNKILKERLLAAIKTPPKQRMDERYRKLQGYGKWGEIA